MRSREIVKIHDAAAEVEIAPWLGAGLSRYDWIGSGERTPLFRACLEPSNAHPFDLALNLLVPWSNRISGPGFPFAGRFHRLEPNLPGEERPIHGNGFSSAWTLESVDGANASLTLDSFGPGPFRYNASVTYALEDGALSIRLSVRNAGDETLPFGLGLHPWLPRTPATTLMAKARRVVREDARHLPAGVVDIAARPEWDFSSEKSLPGSWINNAFLDWDGRAHVRWADRALALEILAEPAVSTYILYSPAATAEFFCFEPVTHEVDAHNLPGGAQAHGLVALAPGAAMSMSGKFSPQARP
jgi:aldose 1-epimerase